MTADDVVVTIGRTLSSTEEEQVEQWLTDVETIIFARLGDLTLLNQDVLGFVEREAVAARLRNPDGVQSEKIDDYAYTMPANSRRITILDEWWDMLSPGSSAGVFSVRPSFETDDVAWSTDLARYPWCEVGWDCP